MIKFAVGILGKNMHWHTFLESCGLLIKTVDTLHECTDLSHIFVTDRQQCNLISAEWIAAGKTIIDCHGALWNRLASQKIQRRWYGELLTDTEQCDIFSWCRTVPKSICHNLWAEIPINSGTLIHCGIPGDHILTEGIVLRKGFPLHTGKDAAEEISLMDKGAVQRLFLSTFRDFLFRHSLTLIRKAESPVAATLPLLFRVDTDFSTAEVLKNYRADIATEKIKTTWFVHCAPLEEDGHFFAPDPHDEIALHCYQHRVNPPCRDLFRAISYLRKQDYSPRGYAAPYGIHNAMRDHELQHKKQFLYSSDFSFAADALPFIVPQTGLLQIPIFPLCMGSFRGLGTTDESIISLFTQYFARQWIAGFPFVIYDHPGHTMTAIMQNIFRLVHQYPLHPMTFSEYAMFKQSCAHGFSRVHIQDNDEIHIQTPVPFPLTIDYPNGKRTWIPPHAHNTLEEHLIPLQNQPLTPPHKVRRLSPRLLKNMLINRLFWRKY